MHLLYQTPRDDWCRVATSDVDAFLVDHAACERKASATALSLVAHYPDRLALVDAMLELAQEELQHYVDVYERMKARGLRFAPDRKDPYVTALLAEVRKGTEAYLLDRLLVFGIVEARGCERFALFADALDDASLAEFYRELARAEARHAGMFLHLAKEYFDPEAVRTRQEELARAEARILEALPFRAALH